jgi:Tetratricopeptide repeat
MSFRFVHQLGSIAEGQRDFAAAERWYLKSLKITEKLGNERGAAIAYGQLAIAAQLQKWFPEAGNWFLKALAGFHRDQRMAELAVKNFINCLREEPPNDQTQLRRMVRGRGVASPSLENDFTLLPPVDAIDEEH